MTYTVYVLHAVKYDKIYIGYSSNLEERMKSHNQLAKKGWTTKFRPWTLVHTETFPSKAEAMKREKQLKSARGRAWIREYMEKKISSPRSYPPDGGHWFEPKFRCYLFKVTRVEISEQQLITSSYPTRTGNPDTAHTVMAITFTSQFLFFVGDRTLA